MADILLVEDDADTREALSKFLEKAGHKVLTAGTGRDALTSVISEHPDVILLDLWMPEMDGFGFLNVIRSYRRLANVPVFVITGLPVESFEDRLPKLGVTKIFHKSDSSFDQILSAIQERDLPPN